MLIQQLFKSEIAYLGFEAGKHKADSGLSFYGGDGSVLRNDTYIMSTLASILLA